MSARTLVSKDRLEVLLGLKHEGLGAHWPLIERASFQAASLFRELGGLASPSRRRRILYQACECVEQFVDERWPKDGPLQEKWQVAALALGRAVLSDRNGLGCFKPYWSGYAAGRLSQAEFAQPASLLATILGPYSDGWARLQALIPRSTGQDAARQPAFAPELNTAPRPEMT